MTIALDIIIPVYNEGRGILDVLESLRRVVAAPFRVLICYDMEEDTTLEALRAYHPEGVEVVLVRNSGIGPHGAIVSGFAASTAPAVIVYPADDLINAGILHRMVEQYRAGCEIVAASRFMPGGRMIGCPWLKAVLVRTAAVTLHRVARVPTHDPTNGFRLFSRRVLDAIPLESTVGFTYSLEYLVKCHRLGWKVGEVPAGWRERTRGKSRFRVLTWLPAYLRWYRYAFATTFLRRGPKTVTVTRAGAEPAQPIPSEPAVVQSGHVA